MSKIRYWFERTCYGWAFQEYKTNGKQVYQQARFDWTAIVLLYIREYPHSVPSRKSFEHNKVELAVASWVSVFETQSLPKFRRRALAKRTAQEIHSDNKLGKKTRNITFSPANVRLVGAFSMLEHPRFCLDWLGYNYSRGFESEETKYRMKIPIMDRNKFRNLLAEEVSKTSLDADKGGTKCKRPEFSATGAINGDNGDAEDPFLAFKIETVNREERIVVMQLHAPVTCKWLTKSKKVRYVNAITAVISSKPLYLRSELAHHPLLEALGFRVLGLGPAPSLSCGRHVYW